MFLWDIVDRFEFVFEFLLCSFLVKMLNYCLVMIFIGRYNDVNGRGEGIMFVNC